MPFDHFSHPFSSFPLGDGRTVLRPMLPVMLHGPSRPLEIPLLVDSGADFSLISRELAEVLGITLVGPTRTIDGVGGTVEVFETELTFEFGPPGNKEKLTVRAHVAARDAQEPPEPILGRAGFFDRFDVCFRTGRDVPHVLHLSKVRVLDD